MVSAESPAAIGLVRRDVPTPTVDLHELARRHGYRLVYTVYTDARPLVTVLALVRHASEFGARAVVVPGFEHAESVRQLVAEHAALITPIRLYPRGHRWGSAEGPRGRPVDG
ncbi:hypothetical protein [Nocardia grenadensis]|uniref:hypothetical protein n=1 Tax=Nocardia grenadensis TaxID=931537 RepID=UPI003D8A5683